MPKKNNKKIVSKRRKKIISKKRNRVKRKILSKKIRGGSRASDFVMSGVNTGCKSDFSHLDVKLASKSCMNKLYGNSYNTTGGGKRNINMKINKKKQKGGDGPMIPDGFEANSNPYHSTSCSSNNRPPLTRPTLFHIKGFPQYNIPASDVPAFKQSGGSDWISSQYSRGPVNTQDLGGEIHFRKFNKISQYLKPEDINKPLKGSGRNSKGRKNNKRKNNKRKNNKRKNNKSKNNKRK